MEHLSCITCYVTGMCFWSLTTARVYLGEPTYDAVLGCYSTWRPSQLEFRTIAVADVLMSALTS
jgi:hypothetical protein